MKFDPVLGVTLAIVFLLAIVVYLNSGDDDGDELGGTWSKIVKKRMKRRLRKHLSKAQGSLIQAQADVEKYGEELEDIQEKLKKYTR